MILQLRKRYLLKVFKMLNEMETFDGLLNSLNIPKKNQPSELRKAQTKYTNIIDVLLTRFNLKDESKYFMSSMTKSEMLIFLWGSIETKIFIIEEEELITITTNLEKVHALYKSKFFQLLESHKAID